MNNLGRQFANRWTTISTVSARRGLSVIEVLTSIVVALIGLTGVLIMIPFASSQAEIGMDTERALSTARNASIEMDLRNMDVASNPMLIVTNDVPSTMQNASARAWCVDPMGVAARRTTAAAAGQPLNSGGFPFLNQAATTLMLGGANVDQSVLIQRSTVADPIPLGVNPQPLRAGLSRIVFSNSDDIVIAELDPANPLVPPQPIYDANGATAIARMQAEGEFDWVYFSLPASVAPATTVAGGPPYPADPNTECNDQVFESRHFYVMYKRRPKPVEDALIPQQPYDRTYVVDWPGADVNNVVLNNNFRVSYNGGTFRLRQFNSPALGGDPVNGSNAQSSQRPDIRRGDWMMFTNVIFDWRLQRFVQNIQFYRVSGAFPDTATGVWSIDVEGPDWDFLNAYNVATGIPTPFAFTGDTHFNNGNNNLTDLFIARTPGTPGSDGDYHPSDTIAVHLPDVWTVFERTQRTE